MAQNRPLTPFIQDTDMSTETMNTIHYEYEAMDESMEIDDDEMALENLDSLDNLTQLLMLKREINHFIIHNITPQEGWYDDRFKNIRQYSQLNWREMMTKFHGKDEYVHDTSLKIMRMCDELLEECSTSPNFHLPTYYLLIHEISNLWQYYHAKYIGAEQDEDVIDLIEGLANLMR